MGEQICSIKPWLLCSGETKLLFKPLADVGGIVKLSPNPIPVMLLCCLVSGTSSSEWIENQITRFRGNQNRSLGNNQFQFVDAWANLELSLPIRRCIGPNIRKIHSFWVHLVAMPTIVTNLLTAVAASLYRKSELVEYSRRAASLVKKCVVGGIKLLTTWKRALHGDSDPVPKIHILSHDWCKLNRELWSRVEKKCTARLDDSATLLNPFSAPLQILALGNSVIVAVLVILADVEGRIGKNGIHHARLHPPQDLEAVGVEKSTVGSGKEGLIHGAEMLTQPPLNPTTHDQRNYYH